MITANKAAEMSKNHVEIQKQKAIQRWYDIEKPALEKNIVERASLGYYFARFKGKLLPEAIEELKRGGYSVPSRSGVYHIVSWEHLK